MGPTPEMIYKETLTFAGGDAQSTYWIYTYGFTKVTISGYWTGSMIGSPVLEGTDEPPEVDNDFQPSPAAVEIDSVATLANVKPAGSASTAGARDEYDNVLPRFVRIKMTETNTQAGTLVLTFTFKSAS